MIVEILSFAGCPNDEPARATAERIVGELGLDAEIVTVDVPDLDTAQRLRFLGSPTVRVDGIDVEPGADQRSDYVIGCRIFRTTDGVRGQPDEHWVRKALLEAVGR